MVTLLKDNIDRHQRLPAKIVSDHRVQFTSNFWKALCTFLDILYHLSSAFHPQSNGQTKRGNKCMEIYLLCYTSQLQDDWVSLLPLAEFAHNAVHASTKVTPFFATMDVIPLPFQRRLYLPVSHQCKTSSSPGPNISNNSVRLSSNSKSFINNKRTSTDSLLPNIKWGIRSRLMERT